MICLCEGIFVTACPDNILGKQHIKKILRFALNGIKKSRFTAGFKFYKLVLNTKSTSY